MQSMLSVLFAAATTILSVTASWIPLADIPLYPRQEHTAAFLPPDTIAILGGIIPNPDSNSSLSSTTTSIVQFYSITTNAWRTVAPLPIPLNHPNAAVINGELYVFGGLAETEEAWSAAGDSWVYDETSDEWKSLSSMKDRRGSAALGVWDGKVILAGGLKEIRTKEPFTQESVDTVVVYDTVEDAWVDVPEAARKLPDKRDHAGGAVIDGTFYIVGGREGGKIAGKSTVLAISLVDLEAGWKVGDSLMPTPRAGVSVGGKVYIPGGGKEISVAPVSWFDVFVP